MRPGCKLYSTNHLITPPFSPEKPYKNVRDRHLPVGYAVFEASQGELDIVAIHDGAVCVVEVKTRMSTAFGHPLEAVDERKRRRLWRLAYAWADAHPELARGRRLRLEAIGIVGRADAGHLEHLEDLS